MLVYNILFLDCTGGMVWNDCGTSCPDTCDNFEDVGRPCNTDCVTGCQCPKGTVEHKGVCINPTECPSGKIYVCKVTTIITDSHDQ